MEKCAANADPVATTSNAPFHAVYGYEPHMDLDIPIGEPRTLTHTSGQHHAQRQAEALGTSLKQTWGDPKAAKQTSQARVWSRENDKRCNPTSAAGDLAYLDRRRLSPGRMKLKLVYRWTGPYRMEAVHGGLAKLSLPTGSKIHRRINLLYRRLFANDPLPGQAIDA